MKAGQCPVQRYWHKLLDMIQVGAIATVRGGGAAAAGGALSGVAMPQRRQFVRTTRRISDPSTQPFLTTTTQLTTLTLSLCTAGGEAGPFVCHHAPPPAGPGRRGVQDVQQQGKGLHQGKRGQGSSDRGLG